MKPTIFILNFLLSSLKLVHLINVPGYSTNIEEEVNIPENLQNAKEQQELSIQITNPNEDGIEEKCETADVSGQVEGVMVIDVRKKTAAGVSSSLGERKIELHFDKCNTTVKVILQHKSIADAKSIYVTIDTSDLQYEKNVKLTLNASPDPSDGFNSTLHVTILIPVIFVIAIGSILAFLYRKKIRFQLEKLGCSILSPDDVEASTKGSGPEEGHPLVCRIEVSKEPRIRVDVVNPKENFSVRLLGLPGAGSQDEDSSVIRHFEDFKSLRAGLVNGGNFQEESLPSLPDQLEIAGEDKDLIEKQQSELEDFINKIAKVASEEKCFQLFTNDIINRMIGEFKVEMKIADKFNELLKELEINPSYIKVGSGEPPTITQTITAKYESGGILIETIPATQVYQGLFKWTRWTPCDSSPAFQLDNSFEETTIYGKKTITTAKIEDNKLIKTQFLESEGKARKEIKEIREMVNDDTMKMEVILEGSDISCEFICKKVKSDAL